MTSNEAEGWNEMGYCMRLVGSRFEIYRGHFTATYEAAMEYAHSVHWADVSDCRLLPDVMRHLRWELVFSPEGDVSDIRFEGEKLWGDDKLFAALAPFVRDGSYIEMVGEDGHRWRWTFKDGKMTKRSGVMVWK